MDIKLLNDQALGDEDTPIDWDGLGFNTYAEAIKNAAINTPGPFNIGIFGEWGTGKTSLMKLIEKKLNEEENVITVWFNAWKFDQEEHPIIPLTATIIKSIEEKTSSRENLITKKTLNALRAIAYGFSMKSKVKIPGLAEIQASFVAKDMIERESNFSSDPLLDRSLYYQAFEKLNKFESFNKKIIIVIDDLDRCFPDLSIKLLESIKLIFSHSGFIFLLGVSRNVIEGYLKHRYEKEYGIKDFKGQSYLDKIIQLSFYIPPNNEKVNDLSDSIIKRLSKNINEETSKKLEDILPLMAFASGGNPRTTIRFVNNLLIDVKIARDLKGCGSEEGIPIEFFAITRCLQQLWPEAYILLNSLNDLCKKISNWSIEEYKNNKEYKDLEISHLISFCRSDNKLPKLLTSEHGKRWLKDKDLRNETIEFLKSTRNIQSSTIDISSNIFFYAKKSINNEILEIINHIKNEGFEVFYETDSINKENWPYIKNRYFSTCKAIVIFLDDKDNQDDFIKTIADEAISRSKIDNSFTIFPILLKGVAYRKLTQFQLNNYKAIKIESNKTKTLQSYAKNILKSLELHRNKSNK